jgi:hypothetical protein
MHSQFAAFSLAGTGKTRSVLLSFALVTYKVCLLSAMKSKQLTVHQLAKKESMPTNTG